MNTLPYHQVKELIETEIGKYIGKSEEIEASKIKIERKGDETSIKFNVSKDADLYKIVNKILNRIGNMEASPSQEDTFLRYDNGLIYIRSSFGNSLSFSKKGDLTSQEIDTILETYKIGNSIKEKTSPKQRLAELGVSVYDSNKGFKWDYIAGYDNVKKEIKDTVILPLKHPEVYEKIARGTRKEYESIKPKAVLFEGPPGTGKTTSARIIAGESNIPMVYVPVESIMTKWYGESEKNLSKIFDTCHDLGDSIIFLDEIDSLAASREKDMHEATRRILSVLLRKIDGFELDNKTILIGATNRKQDLDSALISRFDVSVSFPLPNLEERASIFGNYAKHLDKTNLEILARESDKMSGRNIKDVCEDSERKWVSKLMRGEESAELPLLEEYLTSLKTRKKNGI